MNLFAAAVYLASMLGGVNFVEGQGGQMVKMCLFYDSPSGHARSDPIINQQCASGHVHTFYGPQNFHPDTNYADIRDTKPEFSSTPFVENQSLYWHPTIYEVANNGDGTETFTRAEGIETSPYYRWDNSVEPKTEAFPPGFRMIAASDDEGANLGGEMGANMFTECCDIVNGDEQCRSWDRLEFPTQPCDFLGIAFAMPTCWNGELGDTNDHKNHMAYTVDGKVAGNCPNDYDRRLPQVQLFVRVAPYKGGKYQLSDGNSEFHFDFFNGWQENKLEEIVRNCPYDGNQEIDDYNVECGCTEQFLTPNNDVAGAVCDIDVRELIIDEATDVVAIALPKGACEGGAPLIPKSWSELSTDLLNCKADPGPSPTTTAAPVSPVTSAPVPATPAPLPAATPAPVSVTPAPAPATPAPITPTGSCVDKPLAYRNKASKNCDWVAIKPDVRCDKIWGDMELWELCPLACDVDCVDCCELNYIDCEKKMDSICGSLFDHSCEAACEEESDDIDECINEECTAAEEECYDLEEEKCSNALDNCEPVCML